MSCPSCSFDHSSSTSCVAQNKQTDKPHLPRSQNSAPHTPHSELRTGCWCSWCMLRRSSGSSSCALSTKFRPSRAHLVTRVQTLACSKVETAEAAIITFVCWQHWETDMASSKASDPRCYVGPICTTLCCPAFSVSLQLLTVCAEHCCCFAQGLTR
jgi:hypothetical protein